MIHPLLLDTCAALWVVADEVPASVVRAMAETRAAGVPIYVSPITAWEVGVLARKGRFKSSYTPQRWFDHLMNTPGTTLAGMPPKVLLESSLLPGGLGGDPADRIVAATAREYGFQVVTSDRALLAYAREGHMLALEC